MTMENKEVQGSCFQFQFNLDKAIPQNDLNIKSQFMFGESLQNLFILDSERDATRAHKSHTCNFADF